MVCQLMWNNWKLWNCQEMKGAVEYKMNGGDVSVALLVVKAVQIPAEVQVLKAQWDFNFCQL